MSIDRCSSSTEMLCGRRDGAVADVGVLINTIMATAPTTTPAVKCMSFRIETSIFRSDPICRLRVQRRGSAARVGGALRQPLEMRPDGPAEFGEAGLGGTAVKQHSAHLTLETLDGLGQ